MAGFVFSRPRLVLRALECVYAEPNYYDLPDLLASVVEELVDAGLAERVSVRRGGTNSFVVRLSVAGKARLCAAQDAALSVAAGVSLVR